MATHSSWVKKIIINFNILNKKFDLSPDAKIMLLNFIKLHGEKLELSARLLNKKRWESLKELTLMINNFISEQKLIEVWQYYNNKMDLHEPIPGSPSIEAVKYLNALLKDKMLSSLEKQIIEYDYIKHEILSADLQQNIDSKDNSSLKESENISDIRIKAHPLMRFKKFNFPITKIIKDISSNKFIDKENYNYDTQELYLFSKNWVTGSFISLVINERTMELIKCIDSKMNIEEVIESKNIKLKDIKRFLSIFIEKGIFKITKSN